MWDIIRLGVAVVLFTWIMWMVMTMAAVFVSILSSLFNRRTPPDEL